MRQDHVRLAGVDSSGQGMFDLSVQLPPRPQPTDAQRNAVDRFYRIDGAELGLDADQAAVMLDARDYAQAIVKAVLTALDFREQQHWAVIIASYIVKQPRLSMKVVGYMRLRFDQSAEPDDLPAVIRQSRPFADVLRFVQDAIADIEEQRASSTW